MFNFFSVPSIYMDNHNGCTHAVLCLFYCEYNYYTPPLIYMLKTRICIENKTMLYAKLYLIENELKL